MRIVILTVLVLVNQGFSQSLSSFPLWGSSWVVAQGNNKRIFPSALPLKPDKVVLFDFQSPKFVTIYYANLDLGYTAAPQN